MLQNLRDDGCRNLEGIRLISDTVSPGTTDVVHPLRNQQHYRTKHSKCSDLTSGSL